MNEFDPSPYNTSFATQANLGQDSFQSSVNPAFFSQGWGINPNLLTPSYMAPYRPSATVTGGYQPYYNPSFFRGLYNLSGIPSSPSFGNPIDSSQSSVYSASVTPFDAAAWTGQRVIAPALAYGSAAALLGTPGSSWMSSKSVSIGESISGTLTGRGIGAGLGKGFGQGFAGQVLGANSRSAWEAAGAAGKAAWSPLAHQGLKAAYKSGGVSEAAVHLGKSIGRVGSATWSAGRAAYAANGVRGVLGAGAIAGAGVAGSAIGAFAIPYAVGTAALSIGEEGIWTPYVNTRKTGEDLLTSLRGVTMPEAEGNVITGQGLSRRQAYRLAGEINREGIKDMMFSQEDISDIASLGLRSGLFDDLKASQISQRVKDISQQVKMIVAISGNPDFQEAIESLSKLSMAGAEVKGGSSSEASKAYRGLSYLASSAGTTVERLMQRVGQQGQYLYQMNGMTPYMGQLAAANAYSGFANAERMGLLSKAQLARLGGLEGATQSSLTGQIEAAQTPYTRMMMYNRYIGGTNTSGNLTATAAAFGASVSQNPLHASGAIELYGNQMAARYIEESGSTGVEQQAVTYLRSAGVPPADNGKYTAEQLYAVYTSVLHLPADRAQALIAQRASMSQSGMAEQSMAGVSAQYQKNLRQMISQEGMYSGVIGSGARQVRRGWRSLTGTLQENFVQPVTSLVGLTGDTLERIHDSLEFGSTLTATQYNDFARSLAVDEGGKVGGTKGIDVKSLFKGDFTSDLPVLGSFGRGLQTFLQSASGLVNNDEKEALGTLLNKKAASRDPKAVQVLEALASKNPTVAKRELEAFLFENKAVLGDSTYKKMAGTKTNLESLIHSLSQAQTLDLSKLGTKGELAENLARVSGMSGKAVGEQAKSIYAALKAVEDFESTGRVVSEETVDSMIEKSKDLKALVGSSSGMKAWGIIQSTAEKAVTTKGVSAYAAASGLLPSNEELLRNPEQIHDETIREQVKAARDQQSKIQALDAYRAKIAQGATGGTSLEAPVFGRLSSEDISKVFSETKSAVQQAGNVARESTASAEVSYRTFNEATKQFEEGVKDFVKAVNSLNAKTDTSTSFRAYLPDFFGRSNVNSQSSK